MGIWSVINSLSIAIRLTFHADFVQQCLSTPESGRDSPSSPTPLLREWAKLKLASGSWKDALSAAGKVSIPVLWYPSRA